MASAVKTLAVGVRIEVREGEAIEAALRRFRKAYCRDRGRSWRLRPKFGKKRLDYYQKPSELRRQRALTACFQKKRNWDHAKYHQWYKVWWMPDRWRI